MADNALTIGVKELIFLAALLDGETLLGVDDPFDGWLAHQVEEEWEKLSPEMEAKQYILKSKEGEINVNDSIKGIIKACCFPKGCLMLSRWEKGSRTINNCYYILKDIVIEKVDLKPQVNCSLQELQSPSEVIEKVEQSIPLSVLDSNNYNSYEVLSSVIGSIRDYKSNEKDHAAALLSEKCPEIANPFLLVDALIEPHSYTILILSNLEKETANSYGVSILEGKKTVWKMRSFKRSGEEFLEIEQCNNEILSNEFEKLNTKVKSIATN